jgi:cytidylate kinase
MVITIDGPGGAGKTTLSKALAARLGFAFLDTGALYRAVALCALGEGLAPQSLDSAQLTAWLQRIKLELLPAGAALEGRLVESFIRNEAVASLASRISSLPEVRRYLLELQRQAGQGISLVAEGRDMGTVVFPQADLKFFLTASEEERAKRRFRELAARDQEVTLEQVRREIAQRDERDFSRSLAPLMPARDAIIIDNTDMTENQVLDLLLCHAAKSGALAC